MKWMLAILVTAHASFCFDQQQKRAVSHIDSVYAIAKDPSLPFKDRLKHYGKASYAVYKDLDYGIKICQEYRDFAHDNGSTRGECLALDRLGYAYMMKGEVKHSRKALQECLSISEQHSLYRQKCSAYAGLGNLAVHEGKLDSALHFHHKSLVLTSTKDFKIYQARALLNIGMIYKMQGRYDESLDFLNQARAICEEAKIRGYYASLYIEFGDINALIGEFALAEDYYQQSLKAAEDLYNHGKKIEVLCRLGELYLSVDDLTKAMFAYHDGYELAIEQNFISHLSQILLGKAKVLFQIGEHHEALEYVSEALAINEKSGIEKDRELNEYWAGNILVQLDQYGKALSHLQPAYEIAHALNNKEVIRKTCELLWKVHKELGNHQKSLEFYEEFIDLKTIYDDKQTVKEILKVEMKRSFEQKAYQDSLNNAKRLQLLSLKHEQRSETQRNNLILSLTGAGVLVLIIVLLVRNRRKTAEYSRILEIKNKEVNRALKDKSILLREINHRVKNNMQVASSVLQLKARTTQSEDAKNALLESQLRLQSMQMAHEKIFESGNYESIELLRYINDLAEVLGNSLLPKECRILVRGDEVMLNIEQAQALGFVLHELITNSAKYAWKADEEKEISVFIQTKEKHVTLKYGDNGIGLPADFDFSQISSFGMNLIYSMVERQLMGTIKHGHQQNGAAFYIAFEKR